MILLLPSTIANRLTVTVIGADVADSVSGSTVARVRIEATMSARWQMDLLAMRMLATLVILSILHYVLSASSASARAIFLTAPKV